MKYVDPAVTSISEATTEIKGVAKANPMHPDNTGGSEVRSSISGYEDDE
jgi:hypothetical protein